MSDKVIRRYFVVDSPEAVETGRAIMEQVQAYRAGANALAKEFGFERTALRNDVFGLSLVGFCRPAGDPGLQWRKQGKTREGAVVYVPKRSAKEGKAAAARMEGLKSVPVYRGMLSAVGLDDFQEVWGAVGSGFGVHYASATVVEGDSPCLAVSIPLSKTDSPLPAALEGARELTEHQYATMIEAQDAEETR